MIIQLSSEQNNPDARLANDGTTAELNMEQIQIVGMSSLTTD
jgi:hypothetical protein